MGSGALNLTGGSAYGTPFRMNHHLKKTGENDSISYNNHDSDTESSIGNDKGGNSNDDEEVNCNCDKKNDEDDNNNGYRRRQQ